MSHAAQHHPSYPPFQPAAPVARNGLGTAALVLGILGVLSGLVPLLFAVAGTFGLLALIFGLVGRGRANRREATNGGVATTGAVLALVSLGLASYGVFATFKAVDDVVDEINKAGSEFSAGAQKEPGAAADSGKKDDGKASGKDAPAGKGSSAADFKAFVAANGTAAEKGAVAHVTKVQGAEEQNDILDAADVHTDFTGGLMGEGTGPAKLIASAFADWKHSENGLVTVYDADGELLGNGQF